jgi:hypothetical protein
LCDREEGPAGMKDRSSARRTQSAKTSVPVVRKIVHLRWKQRLGPVPIGARLGMPASTVHAVLTRCRLNRLSHIDRVTGEPVRRYKRSRPGELIHVDVTKFGNIPDGEGEFMPMPRIEHVEDLDPVNGAGLHVYPIITGDCPRRRRAGRAGR